MAEKMRCVLRRHGIFRMRRANIVLPRKCPPVTKTAASRPRPRSSAHTGPGDSNSASRERA